MARNAREPSRWPRRIFTVTGTSTASATASTRRHARSPPSVSISELPAPVLVTLRTGQPMLMSTMSAPASTTITAARAMRSGSDPKICTASGRSSRAMRR